MQYPVYITPLAAHGKAGVKNKSDAPKEEMRFT